MLQLDKHDATLPHINFRKENHGDQKVAAVDVSFTLKASALLLDTIDKKLRKVFFEKPGKGDQQPLPIDSNNLTALSIPYLKEQKLDLKFDGYEVEFGSLLDHIEPLFFADAKLKIEKAIFIEGGSTELSGKVSFNLDEDEDAPLVAAWRRGEVKLTLTPPDKQEVQKQGDTLDAQDAAAANDEAARLIAEGKKAAA